MTLLGSSETLWLANGVPPCAVLALWLAKERLGIQSAPQYLTPSPSYRSIPLCSQSACAGVHPGMQNIALMEYIAELKEYLISARMR
mgnify:CR=1 FL=1